MNELAGARRGALREVVLLAQNHREAAARRVPRNARAVDAAADHEEIDRARFGGHRLLLRNHPAPLSGTPVSIRGRAGRRARPTRGRGRAGRSRKPGKDARRCRRGPGRALRGPEQRGDPFGDAGFHRGIGADGDRSHHRRAGRAGFLAGGDPHRRPTAADRMPRSAFDRAAPPVTRSSVGRSPIAE